MFPWTCNGKNVVTVLTISIRLNILLYCQLWGHYEISDEFDFRIDCTFHF